jgi:hypothetical protein
VAAGAVLITAFTDIATRQSGKQLSYSRARSVAEQSAIHEPRSSTGNSVNGK